MWTRVPLNGGRSGDLTVDAHVPEWVIDAEITDCAYRLYSVLLRYGQSSGQRMPGRALLARRLRKSTDTVDRAMKELVAIGAVRVEHRRTDTQNLTNRYHLMSTPPRDQLPSEGGGRKNAATPPGRRFAATPGRTDAATLAANLRPNPVAPTERTPPPPSPSAVREQVARPVAPSEAEVAGLLADCGIGDLDALARNCQQLRVRLGQSPARWSPLRLAEVLYHAVIVRGWPAKAAAAALLAVAADPATQGPMRLACPGPWWDHVRSAAPTRTEEEETELRDLETKLCDAGGRRVWAQQRARDDLAKRGEPVTRFSVARRACQLLDEAEYAPC